jgi:hypothetical protein
MANFEILRKIQKCAPQSNGCEKLKNFGDSFLNECQNYKGLAFTRGFTRKFQNVLKLCFYFHVL